MAAKKYEVLLTAGAEQDLDDMFDYIAQSDSPAKAAATAEKILGLAAKLAHLPERGAHPKALSALGIRDYRQLAFKPYLVIYRVIGKQVFIYLIADERRDMQALLLRRLLKA